MAFRRLPLAALLLSSVARGNDCLVYRSSALGWGSNVFGLLMTLAANPGSNVVLEETDWTYKCSEKGSWREFFVGSAPLTRGDSESPDLDACGWVQYEHWPKSECPRCGHDALMDRPVHETFPIILNAMRRVWVLSDSLQLHADIQAAYLASLPKPLIGIHVRSGDKANEDVLAGRDPVWFQKQAWVDNLQELLAHNGLDLQTGGTCLMYGDQLSSMQQAAVALKVKLRCTVITVGGSLAGHDQAAFNAADKTRAACDSTRDLILSLEALSRTDVFMGNFNSNIPRLLLLLRSMYGKNEASSRDVGRNVTGWHHNYGLFWHHGWTYDNPKPLEDPITPLAVR